MEIKYLKHTEIDILKWDRGIKKSVNGSIYGYSWFLNTVCDHWDALVDENYETIMPLPYNKFLSCYFINQPSFATNLGVFSCNLLDCETVNAFLEAVPQKFCFLKLNLNKYNKLTDKKYRVIKDGVLEIDLISSYTRIAESYSAAINKSLKDAAQNKISVISGMNSNDLIRMYLFNKTMIQKFLFRKKIKKLKTLVSDAIRFRAGEVLGAYTRDNSLCAAAFFIWSHNRVFLLLFGFNEIGFERCAHVKLIDQFIKQHAGENLTLRFEYHFIEELTSVYTGFGGNKYCFFRVHRKFLGII